jgi:hypothetical protein
VFSPPGLYKEADLEKRFRDEDAKVERLLGVLQMGVPPRKIECYIYRDIEQKYRLSATPGYGNPFRKVWQNHSIGFEPVEHESIHILFEQLAAKDNCPTFWSEGIVGYYYATVDTGTWRQDRIFITQHPRPSIQALLLGSIDFFVNNGYPVSSHVVKFLVDTYGLDKFKELCRYTDAADGLNHAYGMSLDTMIRQWESYAAKHAVVFGPDRAITIVVRSASLPDTSGVYITGDHEALGHWNPAIIRLTFKDHNSWERTFRFPDGLRVNYKITRGSWGKEALQNDWSVPENSILDVVSDSTITIEVGHWKDQQKR